MKVVAPKRKTRLASTTGVAVTLQPFEVRDIPRSLYKMALRAGCKPADEAAAPEPELTNFQADRDEVKRAIRKLVEEGDAEKFTASGRPKIAYVRGMCGLTVSVTLSNEVFDEVMREYEGP
jgi:hypothetical protein